MSAKFDINNPRQILSVLGQRLDTRQAGYSKLQRYFDGQNAMAFVAQEVRDDLNRRMDSLVINFPSLIVNSIAERMTPKGFVIPSQEELTDKVNLIWQKNNMDEQSAQGIIDKLLYGRSYAIVWGDEEGNATISIESPRQMIAWRNPANRKWEAAIKRWVEEDGHAYGVVYTASAITTLRSKTTNADTSDLYGSVDQVNDLSHVTPDGWDIIGEMRNPLGELPVVVIPNRPKLLEPEGVSELDDVLSLADAINKMATDMLVTSEYYAAPRRWATGIEIEEDENGNLRDDFDGEKRGRDGRWHLFEETEAKVGQFDEATLENFVAGIDMLSKYLASVKKIPAHYADPAKSGLASAEAVRAAEAPLVVLAKREMVPTGGALETIARLALMVESGDLPSNAELRMETVWADPENLTASQKVDAVSKKAALGVPREQLWRDAGYSEQEIEDMKRMLAEEQAATTKENVDDGSDSGNSANGTGKRPGA